MRKLALVLIAAAVLGAAACSSSDHPVASTIAPSGVKATSSTLTPLTKMGTFTVTPASPDSLFLSGKPTFSWKDFNSGKPAECAIYEGQFSTLAALATATRVSPIWTDKDCDKPASNIAPFTLTNPISATTWYTFVDTVNGFASKSQDDYAFASAQVLVTQLCDVLKGTWSGTTVSSSEPSKGHNGLLTITFNTCTAGNAIDVSATWKSKPGPGITDDDPGVTYVGTVTGTADGTLNLQATATTPTRCGLSTKGNTTGGHLHASFALDSPTHGHGDYEGQVCDAQVGTFTLDAPSK